MYYLQLLHPHQKLAAIHERSWPAPPPLSALHAELQIDREPRTSHEGLQATRADDHYTAEGGRGA